MHGLFSLPIVTETLVGEAFQAEAENQITSGTKNSHHPLQLKSF